MPANEVTNYSEREILVVITGAGGALVRRPLMPNHSTPGGVAIEGVVTRNADPIRGHDEGWEFKDVTEAYLYEDDSLSSVFFDRLDMHCIPPLEDMLGPNATKVIGNTYTSLPITEDTAGHVWGIPIGAPTPTEHFGPQTVEVENRMIFYIPDNDYHYIRTGNVFTVRIYLDIHPNATSTDISNLHDELKEAMLFWNDILTNPTPTGSSDHLKLLIELVEDCADIDVKINLEPATFRSNTREWSIHEPWTTLAHEFGHYLGLKDEYPICVATISSCPKGRSAKYLTEAQQWYFSGRGKARNGVPCPGQPNLMENNHRSPTPIIDLALVDSVYLAKSVQTLCCRGTGSGMDKNCA